MKLSEAPTEARPDLRNHPEAQQHRPPPVGHESSLQQIVGTPVFQWHHRTLASVYWYPYGEPFLIDDPTAQQVGE